MISHTRRTSLCGWQCCGFLLCFSTLRRYMLDILSALSLSLSPDALLCGAIFVVLYCFLWICIVVNVCCCISCARSLFAKDWCLILCSGVRILLPGGVTCSELSLSLSTVFVRRKILDQQQSNMLLNYLDPRSHGFWCVAQLFLKNWSKALKEGPPPTFQLVCTLHQETLFEVSILETWELVALQIVAQTYTLRNLFTNLGPFCGSMFLPLFPSCPHNTSTGLYFRLLFQRCCFRWSV
jgi:hypothetical protein